MISLRDDILALARVILTQVNIAFAEQIYRYLALRDNIAVCIANNIAFILNASFKMNISLTE